MTNRPVQVGVKKAGSRVTAPGLESCLLSLGHCGRPWRCYSASVGFNLLMCQVRATPWGRVRLNAVTQVTAWHRIPPRYLTQVTTWHRIPPRYLDSSKGKGLEPSTSSPRPPKALRLPEFSCDSPWGPHKIPYEEILNHGGCNWVLHKLREAHDNL